MFDPGKGGYVVSKSPLVISFFFVCLFVWFFFCFFFVCLFVFSGRAFPEPPYIIRAFRADSIVVSPVTLVLNVQLQKTPYLDKMNNDTETDSGPNSI